MAQRPVAALVTAAGESELGTALDLLRHCPAVGEIAVLRVGQAPLPSWDDTVIEVETAFASSLVRPLASWLERTRAQQLLWLLPGAPRVEPVSVVRMLQVARDTAPALLYGDYLDEEPSGQLTPHPLIDYQPGSLRDDFDLGPLLLLDAVRLVHALDDAHREGATLRHGALYDLRLRLSERGALTRIGEPLSIRHRRDLRASGQKNFDYVDPRQRDYQLEMEAVATAHLRRIGAHIPPQRAPLVDDGATYPVEASVVIPVRDRVGKVTEAVQSALEQQAPFAFNVIVVDNHSSDGTTQAMAELAREEPRLVHLVPARRDLGIGGCWNEAIYSPHCGRFAVQLDSDDLYDGRDVLKRIVTTLQSEGCALLVGAYTLVDVALNPIAPGLIDHREWTEQNGRNNALRIHGLGAPRAYHVPTLRTLGFPNVSYGEDYAVVLRLARSYGVARIYDSLYWCRRWEGNSDAALPIEAANRHARYKDSLRSQEIAARQRGEGVLR